MKTRPPPATHPPLPSTSLHLKCSPSQRTVAPRCPVGSSLWVREGQSRTSGAYLKEGVKKKIPISASRMKYLLGNTMQQRPLLYSGHSINQLWNKSWRDIQRAAAKKRKGVTLISKDVRKLYFLYFWLSHLLQDWLKNAEYYCVIDLSNKLDDLPALSAYAPAYPCTLDPCPRCTWPESFTRQFVQISLKLIALHGRQIAVNAETLPILICRLDSYEYK